MTKISIISQMARNNKVSGPRNAGNRTVVITAIILGIILASIITGIHTEYHKYSAFTEPGNSTALPKDVEKITGGQKVLFIWILSTMLSVISITCILREYGIILFPSMAHIGHVSIDVNKLVGGTTSMGGVTQV